MNKDESNIIDLLDDNINILVDYFKVTGSDK